ncbi:MAG: hypothetical protein IPN01_08550 [Deltaproteobacteria bacterium]|nr:hypothetical protein [Deltaproteobacteria bacterium]
MAYQVSVRGDVADARWAQVRGAHAEELGVPGDEVAQARLDVLGVMERAEVNPRAPSAVGQARALVKTRLPRLAKVCLERRPSAGLAQPVLDLFVVPHDTRGLDADVHRVVGREGEGGGGERRGGEEQNGDRGAHHALHLSWFRMRPII